MTAGEDEVVVLVPVLEREVGQRGGVGEFQVGEMPVQNLTVPGGQVHVAGRGGGVSVVCELVAENAKMVTEVNRLLRAKAITRTGVAVETSRIQQWHLTAARCASW